jgi:DNA-binding GntR family transcriptional regulator
LEPQPEPLTLHQIAAVADPIERARVVGRVMAEQQRTVSELARIRRDAIAEARTAGMRQDEIARRLGVSPGRVSQMKPSAVRPQGEAPPVLVQRALPTEPAGRGSMSLFMTEAERQGIRPDRRMLHVGPEPAADHVAAALRVEAGADVLARRKLMLANDVPVRIATSYFRLDLFDGSAIATERGFVRPSLQSAIEALGHRFGHAEEHLVARPPTGFEASTLRLGDGEWIVQVLRTAYSAEDAPVHTLETICAASRHIFPIGQIAGADEF